MRFFLFFSSVDSSVLSSLASSSAGSISYIHIIARLIELILCSFKLAAMKLATPTKDHLEQHYKDLAGKPFYPGLISC